MSAGTSKASMKSTRCVIWHPRRQPVDPELIGALRTKSIELSQRADNEFAAFAAVCTLAKAADAPRNSVVLLIVEPRSHPSAGSLTRLMQKYPLNAAVWVYDRTTSPRLRAASPRDFGEASSPAPAPVLRSVEVPKLRLAGDEQGPLEQGPLEQGPMEKVSMVQARPQPTQPAHLLTDEELALLLATDPRREL
ncbi:MAG: hypothetical protein ACOYN0_00095 [Phycisphaerales bacterium]